MECCIIHRLIILDRYQHKITSLTTFSEVLLLKVERFIRKSIKVSEVVYDIRRVKCSRARRIALPPCPRFLTEVVGILKLKIVLSPVLFCGLASFTNMRNGIFTTGMGDRYYLHLAEWGPRTGTHDVSFDGTRPTLCHPPGEAAVFGGAGRKPNLLEGISMMLCFRISTAEY